MGTDCSAGDFYFVVYAIGAVLDYFPEVIYSIETATSINGGKISDGGHEGPHGLSAGCSLLRVLETVMIFGFSLGFYHGVH